MKGAIVFIIVFAATLTASLVYADMPPGKQIYEALNLPTADYLVLGVPATTLIIAVFNGVFYGIIAWLIYIMLQKTGKIK